MEISVDAHLDLKLHGVFLGHKPLRKKFHS
jgi:hypothetical protein